MVAVIGDVHGCYNTLKDLFNKIKRKYPSIDIYCVGDLVDRGYYCYEVVDFFISNGIKCTPGNHDYMFYDYFKNPSSIFAKSWSYNGNETTLISYSQHIDEMNFHLDYIKAFPLFFDLPDCFISHAGISSSYNKIFTPEMMSDKELLSGFLLNKINDDAGILWNRDTLLNINKLQVVGHTKQPEVRMDKKSNGIYIDTGAYSGNMLSSVILENNNVLDVIFEYTHSDDIS
ncbi:MAG: diadenosine tetraphosphatase [Ignavibacteriales bacterium]|nr:MAG: diadenosine tetraphosphatase [Ignavibacteriales bacterium]